MKPMAVRPKIQIDASAEVANAIKSLAYSKGLTMRQFILFSLAEKYPELRDVIKAEVELPGFQDNGMPEGDATFN